MKAQEEAELNTSIHCRPCDPNCVKQNCTDVYLRKKQRMFDFSSKIPIGAQSLPRLQKKLSKLIFLINKRPERKEEKPLL